MLNISRKQKINWQKINWIDPLELAAQIALCQYNQNWIFLYSGLHKQIKNSKSYLGLYPQNEIISDDFNELEKALYNQKNQYFGYLGYDLKNQLEDLKTNQKPQKSFIHLPNLWMIKFGLILEFDHDKKEISAYGKKQYIENINQYKPKKPTSNSLLSTANLFSNFTKKEYLKKVKTIQKNIADGNFYQANLTRKFCGEFVEELQNPFDIFLKLNQISPANYSAFLQLKDTQIISSSPELFLKIDESGKVLSSPIKGTAKKFEDKKRDEKSKHNLQNSPKEQAENLMIVDLVRNDLSRHCLPSSVEVKNLFKVSSYKTLHHLSSDICGIKKLESTNLDLIKSCFPAGSMTGAPKIKAMEICSELEEKNRGIYSGSIGFLSDEICELSVVIRTIIVQKNKFEFQVGGAITFDSDPQKEWQETMNKAKGITKTLGIKLSKLKII